jgi:DNA-binding winged helix-turn-helix (wHTH) protein
MPTTCPKCGSPVERRIIGEKGGEKEYSAALYCTNPRCFAVEREAIIHAVSRKGFDIVGMGEKIVEQEIPPFWTLAFKRLSDAIEDTNLDIALKNQISTLFLNSIQLQDLFLTIENFKKSLNILILKGISPTFFFIRFDRLKDTATKQLLENFMGLIDATNRNISYVFTSYKPLDQVSAHAFHPDALAGFMHIMFLKPAKSNDSESIVNFFDAKYDLHLDQKTCREIVKLSGGHIHYINLLALIIKEHGNKLPPLSEIVKDERVAYLYDELLDSLTEEEIEVLKNVVATNNASEEMKSRAKYLWQTGFLTEENQTFSPLFQHFVQHHSTKKNHPTLGDSHDFTKKEFMLFQLLKDNLDSICERDDIAHVVWPEIESEGVSDWTIDRLVGRLRNKLKVQKSEYSIVTIKTRGYKLVKN